MQPPSSSVEVACAAKPAATAKPCGIRLVTAPYGHLAHDGHPLFRHYPKPKRVAP